jgi:hypothetical protein
MRSCPAFTMSVALLSCMAASASGERQRTPSAVARNLHGVWSLVSIEDYRPNGEVVYWLGQHPSGVLTYSPPGRVAAQLMRDPRPTFAAGRVWGTDARELLPTATAGEIREAFAGYYAYFGTYDVDESGQAVTHHVKASLRSHEIDLDYVRPFELSGDQLVLRYPVTTEDGEIRTRIIVWRRAERF